MQRYETALAKMEKGESLLHTERMALEKGLIALQEPVVKAAEGMGKVDSSLDKFDRAIKESSKAGDDLNDTLKKDLGKDLQNSLQTVEKEYTDHLKTIGTLNEDNREFELSNKFKNTLTEGQVAKIESSLE
jgi:hypothetical protein